MKLLKATLIIAFFTFVSCSDRVVSTQPDVIIMERGAPPYPGAIWIDNEYRWRNRDYVMVKGHWVKARGIWVPGHWKARRGGYTWIRGHWR